MNILSIINAQFGEDSEHFAAS